MYEFYLDIRDHVINHLICFLLNHCALYTSTIRQVVKQTSYGELEILNTERKIS